VFEIDVDGQTTRAIPRDYQLDPVKDFPLHVDFLRLAAGGSVKVVVPVHVVDQDGPPASSAAARSRSWSTRWSSWSLGRDPDAIEVSVASLDLGSSLHLSDVQLPAGAKAAGQENVTLVTIVAPSGMNEDTAAAPAGDATAAPAKA
jgi:large subunit ribosomal protein L25